jgi:hypothetical protein
VGLPVYTAMLTMISTVLRDERRTGGHELIRA